MATIKEVLEEVAALKLVFATHEEREKFMYNMVKEMHHRFIEGNEKPPLTQVIADHEKYIQEQKDRAAKAEERRWAVKLRAIAEVIGLFGLAAGWAFTLLTK